MPPIRNSTPTPTPTMTKSQFGHLKAMHVKEGDTAEFYFNDLEGVPQLTVLPATNVNKDFINAVMKQSKEASRKARAMRKLKGKVDQDTTEAIERARMEDIQLFVEYIVTDWADVVNTKGKPVKFTKENCRDFLQAIPPEMFHDLRVFCLTIRNFRPELEEMDPEEKETLQGN